MNRKLSDLSAAFQKDLRLVKKNCLAQGIDIRHYFTLRTPTEQAILWRQSRSSKQVKDAIAQLKSDGAPYLSGVLKGVGAQSGKPVTNALPGNSWHQWEKACDCYWYLDGIAEWSAKRKVRLADGTNKNGYHVYAEAAEALGLTAGGHWKSFKDWPHIQQPEQSSPQRMYSWAEIDAAMQSKFEG